MTAVTIIINIVLIIVSIILILTVLMQQGQRQGLGAIGGGAETFFGKNKAKSYEGKLAQLTKICAAVFIILAILATIVFALPEKTEEIDTSVVVDTEETTDETTEETTEEVTEETTEESTEESTEETTEESTEETTEESTEETTEETTEE